MPKDMHEKAAEHHEQTAKTHRTAAQQHGVHSSLLSVVLNEQGRTVAPTA